MQGARQGDFRFAIFLLRKTSLSVASFEANLATQGLQHHVHAGIYFLSSEPALHSCPGLKAVRADFGVRQVAEHHLPGMDS